MRVPLGLGLCLGLVLAGCTGAPTQTAAVGDLPDLVEQPLAEVTSTIMEGGHGEPSLGAAPDGTLFANGNGGQGGAVYRSTDGGASWEMVAMPVEPMQNFDPDLAVDKDGTVWFSALWIGCTSVGVSRDLGETWSFNPVACNAPVSDRQYVVPTQGGEAYLISHQLPTLWQMVAKTTDYGETWIPLGSVEPLTNGLLTTSSGWGGGGFVNPATGSVYFTWTWSDGNPGYAVTRDGGASFETGSIPSPGGTNLGLGLVVGAADDAGNVYLSWGEWLGEGKGVAVYVVGSQDDGKTWTEPIRVDASTGSKVFPAIAAGAAGKVAIAYYEAPDEAYPSDVEGAWNVTLAWSDDLFGAATWRHGELSNGTVKEGPICINGTTCEGDREFLDYFALKRLPDGRVGSVYNVLLGEEPLLEVYAGTRDAILA